MNITLRSERHAWEEVKRRALAAQRRGAPAEQLRALFLECDAIADVMLGQLLEGIHKNPVQRPGGVVVPNRKEALALARIAGYEGDSKTFTRLIIECRVNRQAMNEAWASGERLREAERV